MTYFRLTKIPPQLTLHTLAACASFHHDLCWPKNSVDVQSVVTLIEIICRLALVLNLQVTRFTWRPSISSPFSLCIVFHPMPFPVRNQHIDRNSFVCINYTYAVAMCVCVLAVFILSSSWIASIRSHCDFCENGEFLRWHYSLRLPNNLQWTHEHCINIEMRTHLYLYIYS